MAKSKEKLQALILRRDGESIKVIAKKLSVSAGSVSVWVRDIVLTRPQIKNLQKRSTDALFGKKKYYLEQQKKKHAAKVADLMRKGSKRLGKLSKRDVFVLGTALYWGEGFKKDSLVGLGTSDPIAAKFFIHWVQTCFLINKENLIIRVTINIDYKDSVRVIEKYWAATLGITIRQFSKPFFQKTKWRKEYENIDQYYGVVRIRVRKSINILREIKGSIAGIADSL